MQTAGIELTNNLRAALGVFVTLEKGPKKKLRGCIGYIKGRVPLWQGVVENACNAAEDSRFMPVVKGELQDICIEVSVMTPLIVCQSVDEIKACLSSFVGLWLLQVGQHGLIIEKGGRSGLLLPQVATEEGWDRDTFLEHTCKKAGLHGGAWKEPGTVIKRFSAQVFNEGKLGGL